MIKRNQSYLNRLNALADFLLVFFSYLFSAWFRLKVLHGWWENKGLSKPMILASLFYSAGLLLMLVMLGFYNTTRIRKLTWKLSTLFLATSVSIFIVTAFIFLFQVEDVSRGIILLFYLLTLTLLGGKQIFTRIVFNQLRSSGYNIKHEFLIGQGKTARQYMQDVGNEPSLGIQFDEIKGPEDEMIEEIICRDTIDEIVIALEPEEYRFMNDLIALCEKKGKKYLLIPFYGEMLPDKPIFELVGKSKLINMRANLQEDMGWAALKRVFDILASLAGLIILSPFILIISLILKITGSVSILLHESRIGHGQDEFDMLKFRTDKGFGRFLQHTSLDDIPQLVNVLRGEMSIVGPRPELPSIREESIEEIPSYLSKYRVKPGITGWAQIHRFRQDTRNKKRIDYDLWYIDNWSPILDMKILLMTIPALFSGKRKEDAIEADHADIRIIVATHKPYWMPDDPLYLPMQVGAEGKESLGFTPDNTGDNISSKNPNYCELTGLYWAWKNLNLSYLGLAHYRRHFTITGGTNDRRDVLDIDQARQLLGTENVDVILPEQRNYWIETNYQQYVHAHHAEDLDTTRAIIKERYPDYLESFDAVMKKTNGHRFNMFIMKKELADAYCDWLFDILFELEKRLDISSYSDNDKRVFGFVSERLLDVWIRTNDIKYKDIPYIFLEKENWVSKIANFLKRKMDGGKDIEDE